MSFYMTKMKVNLNSTPLSNAPNISPFKMVYSISFKIPQCSLELLTCLMNKLVLQITFHKFGLIQLCAEGQWLLFTLRRPQILEKESHTRP